jgi:hypothetical protein
MTYLEVMVFMINKSCWKCTWGMPLRCVPICRPLCLIFSGINATKDDHVIHWTFGDVFTVVAPSGQQGQGVSWSVVGWGDMRGEPTRDGIDEGEPGELMVGWRMGALWLVGVVTASLLGGLVTLGMERSLLPVDGLACGIVSCRGGKREEKGKIRRANTVSKKEGSL